MRKGLAVGLVVTVLLGLSSCAATSESAREDCVAEVAKVARDTALLSVQDLTVNEPTESVGSTGIPQWVGTVTTVFAGGTSKDRNWRCSYQIVDGSAHIDAEVY